MFRYLSLIFSSCENDSNAPSNCCFSHLYRTFGWIPYFSHNSDTETLFFKCSLKIVTFSSAVYFQAAYIYFCNLYFVLGVDGWHVGHNVFLSCSDQRKRKEDVTETHEVEDKILREVCVVLIDNGLSGAVRYWRSRSFFVGWRYLRARSPA